MTSTSASLIHPTAVIHAGARIGPDVRIGPYCVIGDEVEIGDGCDLMGHIFMEGPLHVGPRNRFFPYSSIGVAPQDLKYRGECSETVIGKDNTFREFITIHRGTEGGGMVTRIGDGNLLMAYTHIAHDCQVGNQTILANGATLAGHVAIEDFAVVGAFSGVHQFCRIGRHAIIGGYSVITQDVLPFSKTVSEREVRVFGINVEGLKRRGFSLDRRKALNHAFLLLREKSLNTSQAVEKLRAECSASEDVLELIRFIEGSQRGVIK
ncbi:MAG: acyl-[acyl-carrier-protein]--UDP-N-acetylglucosamine O-acyltransferase [Acidobacteria bacterium RIFCSPLOWO2_12_FULL_54_10]|nr:MAG: acyl-[acyl-carrier-protein]--UDP-N-acetylglucosamine O-acyltransferase [Acidobacteria bacterium RIFCSPLOWO2_12_FULL_54_10]